MEATLLHLVLDVAPLLLTQVAKYFGKDVFQRIVGDGTPMLARRRNGVVTIVANVESRTETMATLVGGIAVATEQASHVLLGTKDAGDDDAMERNPLDSKGVEIVATDVLQQQGGTGNKVGNAVRHAPVHDEIGIAADIDKFRLAMLGLVAVAHGTHAPPTGGHYLDILHVGEAILIAVDTTDGVVGWGVRSER